MPPCLYRTTRPLLLAARQILARLGLDALGSSMTVVLIGLYVTGLILLDAHRTQTRASVTSR